MMDEEFSIYECAKVKFHKGDPPEDSVLMYAMVSSSYQQKMMAQSVVFGVDSDLDPAEMMVRVAMMEDSKVSDLTLLNFAFNFFLQHGISLLDFTKIVDLPGNYLRNWQALMKISTDTPTSNELEDWFGGDNDGEN